MTTPDSRHRGYAVFDDLRTAVENSIKRNDLYTILEVPELPPSADRLFVWYRQQVNPYRVTCTCAEQQEYRSVYPAERDIRRVCKHLCGVLKRYDEIDPLLQLIIKNRTVYGAECFLKRSAAESRWLFGLPENGGTSWVNCYTYDSFGMPRRFAFHLRHRRWAYDARPENETAVTAALRLALNAVKG